MSLWQLGVPLYDKELEDIRDERRQEVIHQKRLILPRFKEIYEQEKPPRHPYKVKMQVREELEIDATQKERFQETAKALDMLKDEFLEDWKKRETRSVKGSIENHQ